jgi:glycosyltransferase involved in cell wall biosynthesis
LIESIHKVLTNPKYAQRLGESARRFVEDEFSIDSVLEKYIDLYETIRGVHVPQNIGGLHES